jgi:hypothetical protein
MRKTLLLPSLLLTLAGSASAATADLTPAAPSSLGIPQPTFMTSCTVSCYSSDPYNPSAPPLSCTSTSGNCYHYVVKSAEVISCDGVMQFCPTLM